MTAQSAIVDFPTLQQATRYKRAADVAACLRRQGIRYFEGRDGVWTTLALVNQAGGIQVSGTPANLEPYSPDLVPP